MGSGKRPAKHAKVKAAILEAVAAETVQLTRHAIERMEERQISYSDLVGVFYSGFHEARKDQFDALNGAWNYAMRGKLLDDDRELRVVVALDPSGVLVITAIDLGAA